MFERLAGLSFTTVAYEGGGPAMISVLSGEVDFQFAEGLPAMPQIKAGKVRALRRSTFSDTLRVLPGSAHDEIRSCPDS